MELMDKEDEVQPVPMDMFSPDFKLADSADEEKTVQEEPKEEEQPAHVETYDVEETKNNDSVQPKTKTDSFEPVSSEPGVEIYELDSAHSRFRGWIKGIFSKKEKKSSMH